MTDLDGEQREALEEVDLNQIDLTPPKPGAANKQSVDWTVVYVSGHLFCVAMKGSVRGDLTQFFSLVQASGVIPSVGYL